MDDSVKTVETEIKIAAAKRKPPGDRWIEVGVSGIVYNSLTDVLEHLYQKTGNTQFYIDAREGVVYVIKRDVQVITPEPEKKYSLYGED